MPTRPDTIRHEPLLSRWLRPQDCSADRRYRPPSALYGRVSRWVGVPLTILGLAPRHAVTLEVPAGESEWVPSSAGAPVLAAYQAAGAERSGPNAARVQARDD